MSINKLLFYISLFSRVIPGFILFIFSGTIVAGIHLLKPVLLEMKTFHHFCQPDQKTCETQILWINLLPIGIAAGVNATSILMGIAHDKWGGKRAYLIILVLLMTLSGILFSLFLAWDKLWQNFFWAPALLGVILVNSSAGLFFLLMSYAFVPGVSTRLSTILQSIFVTGWDLCASVFFIHVGLFKLGVPLLYSLLLTFTLSGAIWMIFVLLSKVSPYEEKPMEEEAESTPMIPMDNQPTPQTSAWSNILSPTFLVLFFWKTVSFLWFVTFIGTVYDRAYFLSGGNQEVADHHTYVFSVIFPFVGAICGLFSGIVLYYIRLSSIILTVLSTVSCILITIPYLPAQYATYVIFSAWRIFSFQFVYSFVKEFYPITQFGVLTTIQFSVAGLIAYSSWGINAFVFRVLNGDFFIVNVGMSVISFVAHLMFIGVVFVKSHQQRKASEEAQSVQDASSEL